MRTDTLLRLAFEPDEDHLRSIDVPSVVEKLFYELSTTFTDTHAAE